MCGISIIINKSNLPVADQDIRKVNDIIAHRGPDSDGFFIHKNFAFGHRRLSILDLSPSGHQPMKAFDYTITYNGEVYNYLELKNELSNLGYTFNTTSDTEVLVAAYKEWGTACTKRFNGMWAFCIYDPFKNILFFSRDRFGVKPLYYAEINNQLIFGSEIKQILELKEKRVLNRKILLDKLICNVENHTNETFFEGIYSLEPSHNMVYSLDTNSYTTEKYFELLINEEVSKMSEEQSINYFKDLLFDAVKLRLRSDVKVGTCLSGGLDSSAIAAMASKIYHENSELDFTAIHAKASESKIDESLFAKEVADYTHLELHTVEPSTEDFIRLLDEVFYTQEEPFVSPSMFMGYSVFQKAKELECKVMLNGQGGDEILLGYERYYASYILSLPLSKMFSAIKDISQNSKLSLLDVLKYFFYFSNTNVRKFVLRRRSSIKEKYLTNYDYNPVVRSTTSFKQIFKMQLLEIKSLQLPHLLRYEDRNSMRSSIETRLPFLDYRVVEAALSINNHYKIKHGWTKYILRKAVDAILPRSITWRKNKLGFEAPTSTWLKENDAMIKEMIFNSPILIEMVDLSNVEKRYHNIYWKDKWNLFSIAKWEQIYNVSLN